MHFYYGDGKGKTTAALGLALRAVGWGKSVVIVQFLKDWKCGELSSLAHMPDVTVFRGKMSGGVFFHELSEAEKAATKALHDDNLKKALDMHKNRQCDLLVLDEALDAYQLGALDHTLFEGLIDNKPELLELVVTGHSTDARLLMHANYVTEMVKRKHPYDEGIAARRGIEY